MSTTLRDFQKLPFPRIHAQGGPNGEISLSCLVALESEFFEVLCSTFNLLFTSLIELKYVN
jgi:hypothetical protein